MDSSEITLEAVSSISQIPAEEGDACANPPACPDGSPAGFKRHYNPFVSHAFFSAVEASGSATPRTGWGPRHLLARRDGLIAGIVPCYLKSHSQGEYVFDRGWADAYDRAGGQYYPKLQASVPFTPATGTRLLIRDGVDSARTTAALAGGLIGLSTVSCSGPTSSSTGTTKATARSRISSTRSTRATARRSAANAATRSQA